MTDKLRAAAELALEANGCERIRDFYSIGPVQRAAVESFAEALRAEQPAEPVEFLQFLTDVVTAAGLLAHGKTDKALAARISDFAIHLRTAPQPAKQPLTDEEILAIGIKVGAMGIGSIKEYERAFARAIEAAHGIK